MSNPVLTFTLTADQWAAAKAAVQQQAGLPLNGDSGRVGKDGVSIAYSYVAATGQLTVQVVGRDFFDPSVDEINTKLTAAIQAILQPS